MIFSTRVISTTNAFSFFRVVGSSSSRHFGLGCSKTRRTRTILDKFSLAHNDNDGVVRRRRRRPSISIRTLSSASNNNEGDGSSIIYPKHRKSYHIQGTSTSPATTTTTTTSSSTPSSSSRTNGKRMMRTTRRRSCGPGVTIQTVQTNHTLQTDIPKNMGGMDLAPQPVEMLLSSLIGCTQATAIFVGRQLGITIEKIDFDIQAIRDERGALQLPINVKPDIPSRLQEITGTVMVYYTPQPPAAPLADDDNDDDKTSSSLLSPETLDVLREQTEARCPVANMVLASGCQMNVEWISIPATTEEQEE